MVCNPVNLGTLSICLYDAQTKRLPAVQTIHFYKLIYRVGEKNKTKTGSSPTKGYHFQLLAPQSDSKGLPSLLPSPPLRCSVSRDEQHLGRIMGKCHASRITLYLLLSSPRLASLGLVAPPARTREQHFRYLET